MILTILIVTAVVGVLVGVWLNHTGDALSDRAFGGLILAVVSAGAALMLGIAVVSYGISTPVRVRQLEARYDLLHQALEQKPTLLTAAAILEASTLNSDIIGWRRWERSAWLGWWYADLRPDVQVLSLKGGTHD